MPCYHPITAYWSKYLTENGKRKIVFNPKQTNDIGTTIQVPCGQCIGCRLEYARTWALRCWHESLQHSSNYFITLTYDDDHLKSFSLQPDDLTLFLKRLRKKQKIRYFACGEYGDKNGRPHFHAIVFGLRLSDLRPIQINACGDPLYRSKFLENIWPFGFITVGAVTFQSCSYVARYVMKKLKGKAADKYQQLGLVPPFVRMSRKPGIGKDFFEKNRSQIERHLYVRSQNGAISPLPRYYRNLLSDSAKYRLDLQFRDLLLHKYNDINYIFNSPRDIRLDDFRAYVLLTNKENQITSLKRNL